MLLILHGPPNFLTGAFITAAACLSSVPFFVCRLCPADLQLNSYPEIAAAESEPIQS